MARMKFLCDTERCIECNGCVTACKNEHEVPWGVNRRRVVTVNDGLQGLRTLAEGCPACMLSTIVLYRITPDSGYDPDAGDEFFDYKAESVSWWSDVNANKREWAGY